MSRDVLPDEVSPHTKRLLYKNGLRNSSAYRMIGDVRDVDRCQLHILFLKSLMDLGIEVKELFRVVYFKATPWMRDFVLYNTKRRDQARDPFEKSFFKLIINRYIGRYSVIFEV